MNDGTQDNDPMNTKESAMQKIWLEEDITLPLLAMHLRDSGLDAVEEGSRIELHTEDGIGYLVRLDMERRFVRFSTLLPLDQLQPLATRREFVLQLNEDFFLPSFSVDDSGDLRILYVMPYWQGLIAGQFMAIIHRFGSLLDYLVRERNPDGIISFDTDEAVPDESRVGESVQAAPAGRLLN
jgi:hypothetical protein